MCVLPYICGLRYESDQKDNETLMPSSTVIPSIPSNDKNGFGWVKLIININIFLYSTCYFIQSETLPVSLYCIIHGLLMLHSVGN